VSSSLPLPQPDKVSGIIEFRGARMFGIFFVYCIVGQAHAQLYASVNAIRSGLTATTNFN
jgi:hypothetical protein